MKYKCIAFVLLSLLPALLSSASYCKCQFENGMVEYGYWIAGGSDCCAPNNFAISYQGYKITYTYDRHGVKIADTIEEIPPVQAFNACCENS